jgi:hypothetical protein
VALLFSKAIRILIFLGLVLLIIVFIHWLFDQGYYNSVGVSVDNGEVTFSEVKTGTSELSSTDAKWIYLNEINSFSRYFFFLQIVATLLLSHFIVREVIRILRSVQALQPFHSGNVASFRRIGYLCLSITALNCFRVLITGNTFTASFSLDYTLLIFMLITFILAEIFKEGQKLYEQEKLTI